MRKEEKIPGLGAAVLQARDCGDRVDHIGGIGFAGTRLIEHLGADRVAGPVAAIEVGTVEMD